MASRLVTAGLLAWLVAAALPWWVAENETYSASFAFGLWDAGADDVVALWVWTSVALAVVAFAFLFLRVAANSAKHEPKSFQRDVGVAVVAMALSLAAAILWPVEVPFWGTLHFEGDTPQVLHGAPGPGWWVGLVAIALVAWGRATTKK